MRANEAYWARRARAGEFHHYRLDHQRYDPDGLTTNCTAAVCSAAQVAAFDVGRTGAPVWPRCSEQYWFDRLLHRGSGSPVTCTITVTWTEDHRRHAATASGSGRQSWNYTLLVQP